MNDSVEKALREIELPKELHERVYEGIRQAEGERSRIMTKGKVLAIMLAAALMVTLLCAAAYQKLKGYGESFKVQYDENGKTVGTTASLFDPAVYRNTSDGTSLIYITSLADMYVDKEHETGDPEEEMRKYVDENLLKQQGFTVYSDGEEFDFGENGIGVGEYVDIVGPYSEFRMTRTDENTYEMVDEYDFGFRFHVFAYTGDTVKVCDAGRLYRDMSPYGSVMLESGDAAELSRDDYDFIEVSAKAGQEITLTLTPDNENPENIGKIVEVGYQLGDEKVWKYSLGSVYIDEYANVIKFTIPEDGDYKVFARKLGGSSDDDSTVSLASVTVEVK